MRPPDGRRRGGCGLFSMLFRSLRHVLFKTMSSVDTMVKPAAAVAGPAPSTPTAAGAREPASPRLVDDRPPASAISPLSAQRLNYIPALPEVLKGVATLAFFFGCLFAPPARCSVLVDTKEGGDIGDGVPQQRFRRRRHPSTLAPPPPPARRNRSRLPLRPARRSPSPLPGAHSVTEGEERECVGNHDEICGLFPRLSCNCERPLRMVNLTAAPAAGGVLSRRRPVARQTGPFHGAAHLSFVPHIHHLSGALMSSDLPRARRPRRPPRRAPAAHRGGPQRRPGLW